MHLYGLGHCIFNRCIMMGTGHLVEDFAAPFHLCGVCLRKMQWRLGFNVVGRDYLCAVTMPENKPSQRVMERLGMTYIGIQRHYDEDCVTYEITR